MVPQQTHRGTVQEFNFLNLIHSNICQTTKGLVMLIFAPNLLITTLFSFLLSGVVSQECLETSVLISVKRLCSIPKCIEIFIQFKVVFVFPTVTVSIFTMKLAANSSMHACTGEGNGNPLQYSCLENPRDRGAWWAAVYGVAQSQTRLKGLSSSSSSG